MSLLFTLSGCLTYTFVIVSTIILIKTIKDAFVFHETRGRKALLIFILAAILIVGTALGILFQSYGRSIAN